MKYTTRGALVAVLSASSLLFVSSVAFAASGNLSRSYGVSKQLQAGTIVSGVAGKPGSVEPSTTLNRVRVLGVVVPEESSAVALDPDPTRAQVATSGQASVLVSNVNGPIKKGTLVSPSPFQGVGMKATAPTYAIGTALSDFNPNAAGNVSQRVLDSNGIQQSIQVGYVTLSLQRQILNADERLTKLQQLAKSVTGRIIPTARVVVSMIIAVITLIVVAFLMYAAIYGSIVSIGRNPLAKASILRALANVVGLALLAVAIAFGLVFLLLR